MKGKIKGSLCVSAVVLAGGLLAQEPPLTVTRIDGQKNPELVPRSEVAFIFYSQLVALQARDPKTNTGASALSKAAKIDERRALEIIDFVKAAIDRSHQHATHAVDALLCQRANELRTTADVTSALVEIDLTVERHRAQIIEDTLSMMGIDARRSFESYLEQNVVPGTQFMKVDHARALGELKLGPVEVLSRMCSPNPGR